MRRIAIINQKGGVGKTTTTANLGAALAEQGRRVVLVDMDAQANLSLSLGVEAESGSPTSYSVLLGDATFAQAVRPTGMPGLSLVASHLDLSGAELELASQMGREFLLRDALTQWDADARAKTGRAPADYVLFDCPPSLGLLSINALACSGEVLITLQTEFLALQGMSKLVGVVQLLRKRLNPELVITGILPCLYESRLRLAREVLGEIRKYFPGQVLPVPIRANVKLAEAPSFGQTIFQYAPDSIGAMDYRCAAREILRMESRDPDLAGLPPFRESVLAGTTYEEKTSAVTTRPARAATPREDVAPVAKPTNEAPANHAAPVKAPETPRASTSKPASESTPPRRRAVAPDIEEAGVATTNAAHATSPVPAKSVAPAKTARARGTSASKPPAENAAARAPAHVPVSTPAAANVVRAAPTSAARGTRTELVVEDTAVQSPAVARTPETATDSKRDVHTSPAKAAESTAPATKRETPGSREPAPEKRARRAAPVAARAVTPPAPKAAEKKSEKKHDQAPAAKPIVEREPTAPDAHVPVTPGTGTPTAATNDAPQPKTPAARSKNAAGPASALPVVEIPRAAPPARAKTGEKRAAAGSNTDVAPKKRNARGEKTSVPPVPPPSARVATSERDEPRVLRADDLPPLPPDAFEILASFGLDP